MSESNEKGMVSEARAYVVEESKFFPEHWDEQTKELVKYMLKESFYSGYQKADERWIIKLRRGDFR